MNLLVEIRGRGSDSRVDSCKSSSRDLVLPNPAADFDVDLSNQVKYETWKLNRIEFYHLQKSVVQIQALIVSLSTETGEQVA